MECPRCRRTVDSKLRRCSWCGVNVPPGQHMLEESGVVVPIRASEAGGSSSSTPRLATLGVEELEPPRSEEHTSELQSRVDLVCRLLLEKKKIVCFIDKFDHYFCRNGVWSLFG